MPKRKPNDPVAKLGGYRHTEQLAYLGGCLSGALGACCDLADMLTSEHLRAIVGRWMGLCRLTLAQVPEGQLLRWAAQILDDIVKQMAADPEPGPKKVVRLLREHPLQGGWKPR
jgi:hypothetical protein